MSNTALGAEVGRTSGHTASSFAAAGILYRKLPKRFGIPALLLATIIGFSRLYLGIHYPSDVLCGIIKWCWNQFCCRNCSKSSI